MCVCVRAHAFVEVLGHIQYLHILRVVLCLAASWMVLQMVPLVSLPVSTIVPIPNPVVVYFRM